MNLRNYIENIWVIANARIAYRIARGFFRALVLRRNTLKTIEIFPTMNCNLQCIMCSQAKSPRAGERQLALEDYERVARQAASLGAVSVNILGGEPLVFKRIVDLVRIFAGHGYLVYMVSNAVLATKQRLLALRRAGLHSICFSLDSMDEERNDSIRAMKGHFRKVLEAIEAATEVGLAVNLAPVFMPGRVQDAVDVIEYAIGRGLGASATQAAPVGSFENAELLSHEEHERVRDLLNRYPRLTLDWALSYFLRQQCPAGKEKIGITNFGDVIACSINPLAFGNVREESLGDIWARMGGFSQFRKNSPVCLAAEDKDYIRTFIEPIAQSGTYPVSYRDHPAISAETEPELFPGK
jgi:MoaA/NifB/PqqE/SkfB family radical SAM enzyme